MAGLARSAARRSECAVWTREADAGFSRQRFRRRVCVVRGGSCVIMFQSSILEGAGFVEGEGRSFFELEGEEVPLGSVNVEKVRFDALDVIVRVDIGRDGRGRDSLRDSWFAPNSVRKLHV